MTTQTLTITKTESGEETKKMEFSVERVAIWTLVFTNAYFLSFLIAKLF